MNPNDPIQNLWLGKMQMEMGVQVTNALLSEAKIEALNYQLTQARTENEDLKKQVENMGLTNQNLRSDLESSRAKSGKNVILK